MTRWNWKTVLGIIIICGSIKEFFNVIKYHDTPIALAVFSAVFVIIIGILLIRWGKQKKDI